MTTFGAQDERCLIQPTDHTSTGSNVQLVGDGWETGRRASEGARVVVLTDHIAGS